MGQGASRSPELEELLAIAIESYLADVHTCMPGKVTEYYPETQKVDVKPLLKRRIVHQDGSELLEELPVLPDVPVSFMRSAGFFLSFPIEKGDLVTLHFAERSLDNYLSGKGEDTDPDEFRMHDLGDAIAVPGFYPFKRPIKDIHTKNVVLGKDGGVQIHITPDGVVKIGSDSSADAAVKGTTYRSAEDTMLTAIASAFTALAGEGTLGGAVSYAAATSAINAFKASAATYLATKVNVE